jgi:hypothetical protein
MILTDVQIYTAMREGGFPVVQAIVCTAIALRESGGDPNVVNQDPETGDDSYGLLQINLANTGIAAKLAAQGITAANLLDPKTNARAGVILWAGNNENLNVLWYIDRAGTEYQQRYFAFLPHAIGAALATPIIVEGAVS